MLLPEDPRWIKFAERYAGDAYRFAVEVVGVTPSWQQKILLTQISRSRARVSISSGHGTGKTTSISWVVLWHVLCYPLSVTLLTANDMDQLKATLWKEISASLEKIRLGHFSWISEHIEVLADGSCRVIGFEKQWFVESKTANEKTANKMAGRHGKWFLVIGDEASTLPDTVLETLTGALTEKHNRMLLTSQPTRNAGFFYRTHHDLSESSGGEWRNYRFDSMESPLVSDESLRELWEMYDNDQRRVRLLGQFPIDSSKHLMSLRHAESMYKRGKIISDDEPYGYFCLVDVASGEGLRDSSSCVIARVIGDGIYGENARRVEIIRIPILTNSIKSNVLPGHCIEYGDQYQNSIYVVDSGGLGITVCQTLTSHGKQVHQVSWGSPCFGEAARRFVNLRAQASYYAARAAKEGRLSVLTNEHKKTMLGQSSRIPKTYNESMKLQIPAKHSKEWDGLGSPDLWDAVCFAFLQNLSYVPANENNGGDAENDAWKELEDAQKALLAQEGEYEENGIISI